MKILVAGVALHQVPADVKTLMPLPEEALCSTCGWARPV
jgi:hypothetical protein